MMIRKILLSLCLLATPLAAEDQPQTQEILISTIGTVNANAKSEIGSQVPGRVSEILIDVGDSVRKGQPLIKLDSVFYQIEKAQKEASLEAARIEMHDSELNFRRMKKLWEKPEGEMPSISLKRFEDAKTKYEQSVVAVTQAQEQLNYAAANLRETIITAPYDGIITKVNVDTGESIKEAPITKVLEMQSIDPIYIEFSVPQNYLSAIKVGTSVTFDIEGANLDVNEADIKLIYPSVDESTRSVLCRCVVANLDGKIRPGSLAKITIMRK